MPGSATTRARSVCWARGPKAAGFQSRCCQRCAPGLGIFCWDRKINPRTFHPHRFVQHNGRPGTVVAIDRRRSTISPPCSRWATNSIYTHSSRGYLSNACTPIVNTIQNAHTGVHPESAAPHVTVTARFSSKSTMNIFSPSPSTPDQTDALTPDICPRRRPRHCFR